MYIINHRRCCAHCWGRRQLKICMRSRFSYQLGLVVSEGGVWPCESLSSSLPSHNLSLCPPPCLSLTLSHSLSLSLALSRSLSLPLSPSGEDAKDLDARALSLLYIYIAKFILYITLTFENFPMLSISWRRTQKT